MQPEVHMMQSSSDTGIQSQTIVGAKFCNSATSLQIIPVTPWVKGSLYLFMMRVMKNTMVMYMEP